MTVVSKDSIDYDLSNIIIQVDPSGRWMYKIPEEYPNEIQTWAVKGEYLEPYEKTVFYEPGEVFTMPHENVTLSPVWRPENELPPPKLRTEVADHTIYLLWTNAGAGGADAYQIKYYPTDKAGDPSFIETMEINDISTELIEFTIGTEVVHYCVIRELTNYIEYTFEVRAVNTDTDITSIWAFTTGIPERMTPPGGYEADLISVQGINVMPVGGWPAEQGNLRTDPYKVTIALPCTYLYFIVHRNSVSVALGASFTMYRDPGFQQEVILYDRIEDTIWFDEIYMYIKVTSNNGFTTKFYEITVEQEA
jgi:hypothetical protein